MNLFSTIKKMLPILLLLLSSSAVFGVEIWVSPNGNDQLEGSKEKPLATISMALRIVREMRRLNDPAIAHGAKIMVREGLYRLYEPVFIRPEDSGTPQSPTSIEAYGNEMPVLSGGVAIKGWRKSTAKIPGLPATAKGKIWEADAPKVGGRTLEFRQLWVNGQKALRARDQNGDSMSRILSWNKKEQTCWIPKPKVGDLSNAAGLEFFIHQWWAIAILRVSKYELSGDSVRLFFHQPESRIQSEHPWPAPWISKETGNSAFLLSNAIQLLDSPGEWFLDPDKQKLYYWPKEGENLNDASVFAPVIETLLKVQGTSENPVEYVYLKGLHFQHTAFIRPSQQGHVPHQAGHYMLDAYSLKIPGTPDKKSLENQAWVGRQPAAVSYAYAANFKIENCQFSAMAATGLDLYRGIKKAVIRGNSLFDIGGTGIQAGVFSDEALEAHLPYNPTDLREHCTEIEIDNNLLSNITNEDWGCVGIGAGYVSKLTIAHNEISELGYSGISVGWGWTRTINAMANNHIRANKIHHYARHLYDVAAIYTLSAQPGSTITHNYIDSIYKAPYAHLPEHWFYLYCDEGSAYFTVKDNWCPAEKFLRNANGPNNIWENNGPKVSDSIKNAAGLTPAYQHLLLKVPPVSSKITINYSAVK